MWSRRSIETLAGVALLAALAACSVAPKRVTPTARPTTAAVHPTLAGRPGEAGKTAQPAGPGGQAAAAPPPIPPEARQEFDKALALARAGSNDAAQVQLASLAQRYPQFCTPLVDLAIVYRRSGNLDAATHALEQAVARDPRSALAWTELGVTQRLGGKFQDAEQSYAHAIAADPAYAPAYRDRGVLRDLYLDQPAAALGDFQQYRQLAGADKPVAMWIAELQHRTGVKQPAITEAAPKAAGTEAAPKAAAVSAPSASVASGSAVSTSPPQGRN